MGQDEHESERVGEDPGPYLQERGRIEGKRIGQRSVEAATRHPQRRRSPDDEERRDQESRAHGVDGHAGYSSRSAVDAAAPVRAELAATV